MSYRAYRRRAKIFYKTLMSVPSPHLDGAYVVFNNIGFKHLIRKAKVRSKKEQMKRFNLLRTVPDILKDSDAIVSYRSEFRDGRMVHYWAFSKEKEGREIRVVVRQVGNGIKHFYSVMDDR
jgi:hypothetical protein